MKHLFVALLGMLIASASAFGSSFPQCPAVQFDTLGCEFLITVTAVNAAGGATAFTVAVASPDQGPYDGADDTLVGILNNSGATLKSIAISSPLDIFGFDGDGACTTLGAAACTSPDPNGYGGPGVTYSGINASQTSGTVNFGVSTGVINGIANGSSAWFSLEEALNVSQIQPAVPEPASLGLLLTGSGILLYALRRRLRPVA
jgi:hypothetical protein